MDAPGSDLTQTVFFGALILFVLAELLRPRRALVHGARRWVANIGLGVISAVLGRWILPLTAAAMAATAGFGLLAWSGLPAVLRIVLGFILLDALAYGLHRLFHAVPLLWRLHRVHHSDPDVDFTTGFRHHPLELVILSALTVVAVVTLGIPPLALALYIAVRAAIDIAAHANLALPLRLDRALRLLMITPDMHQIHHSTQQPETDSNFTLLLSGWDRLFGTYRATAAMDRETMSTGLLDEPDPGRLSLWALLCLPFRRALPLTARDGSSESPDGPDEAHPGAVAATGSADPESAR